MPGKNSNGVWTSNASRSASRACPSSCRLSPNGVSAMNLALNESIANESAAQYFPPSTRCQCSSVFPSCCGGVKQLNKEPPNVMDSNTPPMEIKRSQGVVVVAVEIPGGLPSNCVASGPLYCGNRSVKSVPSFFAQAGQRYHQNSVWIAGVWVHRHPRHLHPF